VFSNPDDPEWDEDEWSRQNDEAENEVLQFNPYHQALNNLYGLLKPHYDYQTQSYQNVPEQPDPPQGTFSYKQADWYHLAPTTERDRIQQHGLMPADPFGSEHAWGGRIYDQPIGVYAWPSAELAKGWVTGEPNDIWRIPSDQVQEEYEDRALPGRARYIPHQVNPVLHLPYENSADYELQYGAK
jgi:hypothetical protein